MNNKKDYQLLWEGFVSNKRIRLNEMEERYMDLISNATSYAQRHPELLPFPQVFGNDLRKVIPFQQKNVDKIEDAVLEKVEDAELKVNSVNSDKEDLLENTSINSENNNVYQSRSVGKGNKVFVF